VTLHTQHLDTYTLYQSLIHLGLKGLVTSSLHSLSSAIYRVIVTACSHAHNKSVLLLVHCGLAGASPAWVDNCLEHRVCLSSGSDCCGLSWSVLRQKYTMTWMLRGSSFLRISGGCGIEVSLRWNHKSWRMWSSGCNCLILKMMLDWRCSSVLDVGFDSAPMSGHVCHGTTPTNNVINVQQQVWDNLRALVTVRLNVGWGSISFRRCKVLWTGMLG
jgi:hypothetical protein